MTITPTKVKEFQFNALTCDIYSDGSEFFMTREQIGRALGYSNPMIAIANIHDRHAKRLNQFSILLKLSNEDGKIRDTFLYSAKGIYEICRWSRQPKADAFMDAVWDVLESIRTGQALEVIPAQPTMPFPMYGQAEPLSPQFYLASFLSGYLLPRKEGRERVDYVYAEYVKWCIKNHRTPAPRIEFNRALIIYNFTVIYNLRTAEYELEGVSLLTFNNLQYFDA